MTILNDASAVYLGDVPVSAIYAEEVKVWPTPFSPASIPNLDFWMDPIQDAGIYSNGQPIVTYIERGPHHRTLLPVQTTPYPTFRNVSGKCYIDNTHPNSYGFYAPTPWNPGPDGITFLLVMEPTESSNVPMMAAWGPTADGIELRHPVNIFQLVLFYTADFQYFSNALACPDGSTYLFALRISSTLGNDSWVNDTKTSGGHPPVMPNIAQYLWIGQREGGYPFFGYIREALVYGGAVSDNNLTKLFNYLKTKHELPM